MYVLVDTNVSPKYRKDNYSTSCLLTNLVSTLPNSNLSLSSVIITFEILQKILLLYKRIVLLVEKGSSLIIVCVECCTMYWVASVVSGGGGGSRGRGSGVALLGVRSITLMGSGLLG